MQEQHQVSTTLGKWFSDMCIQMEATKENKHLMDNYAFIQSDLYINFDSGNNHKGLCIFAHEQWSSFN